MTKEHQLGLAPCKSCLTFCGKNMPARQFGSAQERLFVQAAAAVTATEERVSWMALIRTLMKRRSKSNLQASSPYLFLICLVQGCSLDAVAKHSMICACAAAAAMPKVSWQIKQDMHLCMRSSSNTEAIMADQARHAFVHYRQSLSLLTHAACAPEGFRCLTCVTVQSDFQPAISRRL